MIYKTTKLAHTKLKKSLITLCTLGFSYRATHINFVFRLRVPANVVFLVIHLFSVSFLFFAYAQNCSRKKLQRKNTMTSTYSLFFIHVNLCNDVMSNVDIISLYSSSFLPELTSSFVWEAVLTFRLNKTANEEVWRWKLAIWCRKQRGFFAQNEKQQPVFASLEPTTYLLLVCKGIPSKANTFVVSVDFFFFPYVVFNPCSILLEIYRKAQWILCIRIQLEL